LLALPREASLYNAKEAIAFLLRYWKYVSSVCGGVLQVPDPGMHIHAQNGGVNLGRGIKRVRRDACNDAGLPIKLHAHTKQTEISRNSNDALCNFILHHYDEQSGRIGTLQEMTEGRGGDIVWQICH